MVVLFPTATQVTRRPRMGAWIEISDVGIYCASLIVAPAWGRGLKWRNGSLLAAECKGRPRMGAWIEITKQCPVCYHVFVAPAWGRGLKLVLQLVLDRVEVAPAWGRGLKSKRCEFCAHKLVSPPHGGVD